MKLLTAGAVIILVGCATPRSAFPPIANMHSPTLCYIDYAGNLAEQAAARVELGKRNFGCNEAAVREGAQQWAAMAGHQRDIEMQAQANRNSAIGVAGAIGLGMALAPGHAPAANCITQRAGTTYYTNCR